MAKPNPFEPIFSPECQPYHGELPHDGKFRDFEFEEMTIHFDFQDEFNGCRFKRVRLSGDFKKTTFVDCHFDQCDLSNTALNQSLFFRVRFENCKGTGSLIRKSKLKYTEFIKCAFPLSDFSESNFEHVRFMESNVSESAFQNIRQLGLMTVKTDMTDCDFIDSSLNGMDFSGCTVQNIRVSPQLLKGLTVDSEQAIGIATLLGVKIKDR